MGERLKRSVLAGIAAVVLMAAGSTAGCSKASDHNSRRDRSEAASAPLAAHSGMYAGRGNDVKGQELFAEHCAPCHLDAPKDLLKEPPNLYGLFNAPSLPSGSPATNEQVGKEIIEGIGTMPAFDKRLSGQDVQDLIAYLHLLK